MNRLIRLGTLAALSLSLGMPSLPLRASGGAAANPAATPDPTQLARGGGRGGGGGRIGGGGFGGGGGSNYGRSSGSRPSGSGRTGFGNYSNGGSAYRGSSKPAGGFSSGSKPAATRQQGRQDLAGDRQGQRTDRQGQRTDLRSDRQGERTDRTEIRQDNRTDRSTNRQDQRSDRVSDRTDLRGDRVDNRWDNYWSGWARPGWGYARPWGYGWYGGVSTWPWWRPGLGFTALASAAIIADAVDDAINDQVTYIMVPDTSYELYYTSLQPVNNDAVTFAVDTGSGVVDMTADCRQGTLDGRVPQSQGEAQLLNAACEVAFGKG